MQEVTAGSKGTNPEGTEGAAWDVPATTEVGALLCGTVDKQATVAIVAVATCVVAATQLRLVLWMVGGNMEFVEAVGKLAALGILAETII